MNAELRKFDKYMLDALDELSDPPRQLNFDVLYDCYNSGVPATVAAERMAESSRKIRVDRSPPPEYNTFSA